MFGSLRKGLMVAAALGALALGGSALAGAATKQSSTTNSASSTSGSGSSSTTQSRASMPDHGTAAHEDTEKPVTGAAADKAKAAAVKSVGSGTAGEVTSDFTGDGYEVTVTKADGSKTEVHLDKSFNVRQGPGGGHDGDGPGGPPGG
jgi:cytoskeletal protein RodZ